MRTFLHAQRDWYRRYGLSHVLIIPGATDSVTRDGSITVHTVASPFVPGSDVYRLLLRSDKVLRILEHEMPDVVETHCTYNLPWTALLHRRRHGGIVSAFFMTDVAIAYVETPVARRLGARVAHVARRVTERYMRALYLRCDIAFAISPIGQKRLHEIGIVDTHVVPLGVDLEMFTPAVRDVRLRKEFGADDDALIMIYTGRFDSEKRADLVLEAFALLPTDFRAQLVLAGDGVMRETLEQRAREVGRVHVLPFMNDRAQIARTLASCDIYVSAMAHETFGLSVIEAQACGLPVVGVRAGAMVDRVRDGDGFLVEPYSPRAMADRIMQTPRSAWRQMGLNARTRIEAEFSWDRTFEEIQRIYEERLSRP